MINLETQDAIFYTNLIILFLCISLVSFIIYVLYRTFKTELKRKEFIPNIKLGDLVYTPVMSGGVRGKILDIKDDKVTMIIEVPKSRIYPNE